MDFGLQSDWLAENKNRHTRKKYPPEQLKNMQVIWPHLMIAHCLMHGGAMYVITQSPIIAVGEFVAHFFIDMGKCERWYGFHTDQLLHVATKIVWVILLSQGYV